MKNIFPIILFGLLLYPLTGCDSNKQAIAPTSQKDTSTNNHTPTDTVTHKGISITLWNQPLDTIRKYTLGKWQLIYTIGAEPFYDTVYRSDLFWTIAADSLKEVNKGKTRNYSLDWQWAPIITTGSSRDSTFWMSLDGYPEYRVQGIENDTLVMRDRFVYPEAGYFKFRSLH